MDLTETLALVFTDQFIASLLLPINRSYVFDAIVLMQREIIFLSIIAAVLGSFLGSILNYFFGRFIARAFLKVKVGEVSNPKYKKFYYFLILTPFDLAGSFVTFLAGFGHMRLRVFALASFASNLVYFLYKSF
jgi:membrane protein YqaA with SNARE-associated domain